MVGYLRLVEVFLISGTDKCVTHFNVEVSVVDVWVGGVVAPCVFNSALDVGE